MAELLGEEWDGRRPPSNSREELRLSRRITRGIAERIDTELADLVPHTIDPPEHPRRWTWLTRLLR